jgi:hypothetical protein
VPTFSPIEGDNLKDLLIEKGNLTPPKITQIIGELLPVLEFLNNQGYSYGPIPCDAIYIGKRHVILAPSAQLKFQVMGSSLFSDAVPEENQASQIMNYKAQNCFDQDLSNRGLTDVSDLSQIIFTMATCLEVNKNKNLYIRFKQHIRAKAWTKLLQMK